MAKAYEAKTKKKTRRLRSKGWSLGEISKEMKIPKNTLSGWLKDIRLSEEQKERIKQKIRTSGAIGRPIAVKLLHDKIEKWKNKIRQKVKHFEKLTLQNQKIGKLACGLLYLCEGAKYPASRYLYLGNSDPKIISFFLNSLREYYSINEDKLRFDVLYRWDQNYDELKEYWSKITKIPKSKCLNSKPDLRTKDKPTLKKDYKGICRVIYYDTSLQFELQAIGETIINGAGGDRTLGPLHAMQMLIPAELQPHSMTIQSGSMVYSR